jgi:hypothetical protein
MCPERNENDSIWWTRRKRPIFSNLGKAIEEREKAMNEITRSQQSLGRVGELLSDEILRLQQIQSVYGNNQAYLRRNPATEGTTDFVTSLSTSDLANATRLASSASAIRTNSESFVKSAEASGSAAISMSSATVYLASSMVNNNSILPLVERINEPTPNQRRIELSKQLSAIENRLSIKLNGAWQTIQDHAKIDRFLQAASSAREVISDVLHILAPDEKVTASSWFKPETENGKPSRRQRAKFAMLDNNDSLTDEQLEPIHELGETIRNLYERFNPIAHLREYETNLQGLTESLIDQCQIYLLKLLEFRAKYFKG